MKRNFFVVSLLFGFTLIGAQAQTCKVCAEQRSACMKNYAGPACKTEYQMCLKACKK